MKDRWSSSVRRSSLRRASHRRPAVRAEQETQLQVLQEEFPKATKEEHMRFLKACKNDLTFASKELQEYLDWREKNNLDSPQEGNSSDGQPNDAEDWSYAAAKAITVMSRDPEDTRKSIRKNRVQHPQTLPSLVGTYYDENGEFLEATNGAIIIQVLPALIDKTLASNETYALAMAFYLDRKFSRSSLRYGSLLIDVRPGRDWPNPSAKHLVPFIKEVARMLPKLYPERLQLCLVYPMPRFAKYLWFTIRPILSEAVSGQVVLISGSSAMGAPPPVDLGDFIGQSEIDQLEEVRKSD